MIDRNPFSVSATDSGEFSAHWQRTPWMRRWLDFHGDNAPIVDMLDQQSAQHVAGVRQAISIPTWQIALAILPIVVGLIAMSWMRTKSAPQFVPSTVAVMIYSTIILSFLRQHRQTVRQTCSLLGKSPQAIVRWYESYISFESELGYSVVRGDRLVKVTWNREVFGLRTVPNIWTVAPTKVSSHVAIEQLRNRILRQLSDERSRGAVECFEDHCRHLPLIDQYPYAISPVAKGDGNCEWSLPPTGILISSSEVPSLLIVDLNNWAEVVTPRWLLSLVTTTIVQSAWFVCQQGQRA